MNEQGNRINSNHAEDGELTGPSVPPIQYLPRVLDPLVTMGVVQKYIETEQKRSRRVLFWMSAVFVFAALFMLVMFILVGMFLYQNSRKAVDISDATRAQVAFYGAEVIGISNKINILEHKDDQLNDLVKSVESNRTAETGIFKTDLQRFSRWVESLNAKDIKVLSELETGLREVQRALEAKDKELEEIKKQYSLLLSSAGSSRLRDDVLSPMVSLTAPGIRKADAPETDISAISTAGVFDAVLTFREEDILKKSEPKGEVSVVTFPGGDRYEGEFKGGLFNGRGIYYYRNGDRYEGEFLNDMKNGLGVYYYGNGDRYTGEFKNDMKDGKGSFVFRNGEKYIGDFKNDAMIGKGTMIYLNGNKYAGDFRNGLKQGNGILSFHNGDIYKGEFTEDLRNGKGIYFFLDGSKYIGEFKKDKRHGQGRYIYPGGEEYVGEFKNGKKDGEGVCVYTNGRNFKGLWKNDKFIEEARGQ